MKKNKLKLSIVFMLVLLAIPMLYSKFNINETLRDDQLDTSNEIPQLVFSEPQYEEAELVQRSDVVVIGNLKSIKEKTVKKIIKEPEDPESPAAKKGEKIKVKAPVIIYNLKIEEVIHGTLTKINIDLIIPDMSNEFFDILVEGNDYKLYLVKNEFFGNNAYSLLSASQGIVPVE